jgi:hypothetical protein
MDNDLFQRPMWVAYLPLVALGSLIVAAAGAVCLASGAVPGPLVIFAGLAAISPIFLVIALVPVLNNEMRLLDSMRMGLIEPDLVEREGGSA